MVEWTRKAWVLLAGATEYVAAIAKGDVAPELEQWARAHGCAACLSKTCARGVKVLGFTIIPRAGYCGPMLKPQPESVLPTCGCLVLVEMGAKETPPEGAQPITINGREYAPAGKPMVGTQKCPQGRW